MKRSILNLSKKIIPYTLRIFFRKVNWRRKYFIKVITHVISGTLPQSKVYCPVTERSFHFFIRIKNDNISPVWGAKSRHRLEWLYLKQKTDFLNRKTDLLHIAPEYCLFQRLQAIDNINYYPGDKFEEGYGVQKGVIQLDLTSLTMPDESFDCIICNHILEHIPDDLKAMTEMYRVLKKGGKALIMVPIDLGRKDTYEDWNIKTPDQRTRHFGQWDHVRFYSLDIVQRLTTIGFNVSAIKYAENFSREEYATYGLCDDYIFIASKD
ncbi:MAG: class I SAM-dependent methyltransferase [Chitinophagales bacterium]